MIGLLDLAGQGLVRAALEGSGHPVSPLLAPEDAMREIVESGLAALVIETDDVDTCVRDLLLATSSHALPTLVVARDRTVATAVETLRFGASDYLAAPFEYESLLRAVDRLIDESSSAPAAPTTAESFITQDPDVLATFELLRSVAPSDATILIEGESTAPHLVTAAS